MQNHVRYQEAQGKQGDAYQVRFPDSASKSGYSYESFDTHKEALTFREDAEARRKSKPASAEIRTVPQGLQKWLDVCEKEGRDAATP